MHCVNVGGTREMSGTHTSQAYRGLFYPASGYYLHPWGWWRQTRYQPHATLSSPHRHFSPLPCFACIEKPRWWPVKFTNQQQQPHAGLIHRQEIFKNFQATTVTNRCNPPLPPSLTGFNIQASVTKIVTSGSRESP